MDNALPVPVPPASVPPPGPRHDSGGILALVNGVLAGVSGVYISTRSVLITVIAALAAIVLTAIVLLPRRSMSRVSEFPGESAEYRKGCDQSD